MKIALIMGGRSGEHEVSLETGKAVAAALERLGHTRFEVVLGKEGGARWPGGSGSVAQALTAIAGWAPDVAFIAMHGADGEDGRVQGTLDLFGIPYQGSGVATSALGMHKSWTKAVYRAAGLPVAADVTLRRGDRPDWAAMADRHGLPLVLKTSQSGSSVGVEVVESVEALAERGDALLAETDALLVEQYVTGREFTVPVLEDADGAARALPVIEIRPRSARFFDYAAKYTPGATDELCPAPIDEPLTERLQALGLAAHAALSCRGYSRTDVIVDASGQPHLLETNTLPGLTRESLFPKAAGAAGMSFEQLVAALLARAHAARTGLRPR